MKKVKCEGVGDNNGFFEAGGEQSSTVTPGYLRSDFERWIKTERGQSVERYDKYPFSYKISELNAMWVAWCAAIEFIR